MTATQALRKEVKQYIDKAGDKSLRIVKAVLEIKQEEDEPSLEEENRAGIKNKRARNNAERKMAAPRFTVSDELTALQNKILFPEKLEEAKAFFKDIR